MATTLDEIAQMLEHYGLRYFRGDDNTLLAAFGGLEHYRDDEGNPHLRVVIQLSEQGRYLSIFAPAAYTVPVDEAGPFLQACAMVQWRTKLIQYEYDARDGEVRPVVEFPLEDAPLTLAQFARCLTGLVRLVDEYDPVLRRALETGEVAFNDEEQAVTMLSRLLSGFPPEILAEALRRADERRRLSNGQG
ncbi:hypothetical protein GQ464_007875 [Rhodocaloribacter litoris]|uniref:hypothetical protein n=1 Tax=Rhodocaloribacter litoris TaxID=2558931 RepID=UPI00141EAEFD|nr:hypothetical protein [Rhodocaloribacter litoris]QXD16845.1 hypothetical protein GQ464_007875 [Rhodocaloribacter litoris]